MRCGTWPRRTRSSSSIRCSRLRASWRTRLRASPPSPRSARPSGRGGSPVADDPALHDWKPLVEDLTTRREKAYGMGGPDRIERQRSLGKRPVRERIHDLLDPGSFVEYGLLADSMDPGLQADK